MCNKGEGARSLVGLETCSSTKTKENRERIFGRRAETDTGIKQFKSIEERLEEMKGREREAKTGGRRTRAGPARNEAGLSIQLTAACLSSGLKLRRVDW